MLTTSQAAKLLGASRQHVAGLADREQIPSWRSGTHRRFQREDVLAFRAAQRRAVDQARKPTLNLTDRRSLAYGCLVAAKLVAEPEAVLRAAQRNLELLRSVHGDGSADPYLDRWEALLSGPLESILYVLTSPDEDSVALRHAAPFAGVLSDGEREQVIRATRRAS